MYFLEIVTAFVVITTLWLYIHVTKTFSFWKKLNIPFINPIPVFGNIYKVLTLQSSIGDVLFEMHKSTNTKYLGFFIFHQPCLLIRDPQIIKHVLIKDFDYFDNRNISENENDPISANITFILKNPKWKPVRTKLTPLFTSGKMKRMLPLILEASEELKCYIRNVAIYSKSTEVKEMCMKYTTDVISTCAFGINAHSFQDENAAFRVVGRRIFGRSIKTTISMSAHTVAPILVKLLKLQFVDNDAGIFLHDVFWKHMKEREMSNLRRNDLIDLLIDLKKSDTENYLDDYVLLAQAVQFFMAGFETTGTVLSFILYSLAKNLDVQRKLRHEIKKVLKHHNDTITYEALNDMLYLEGVISETLRLYPILTYLDRRCNKPYQIPGTDTVLPEGTPVYISLYGLHYDPKNFSDPYKFDPNRFTEENKVHIPTSTYMPFGEGPRNCVGLRFGLMSLKVALVQILLEFEVEACPTTPKSLKFEPIGFLLCPVNDQLDLHLKKCVDIAD